MRKKRFGSLLLAAALTVSLLAGCGGETQQSAQGTQTTETDSGTVTLRVWAEESTWEAFNQMIESFKEEYAGEADFEITLEQNSDSETRDNVLGDVHGAADVFVMADDQLSSLVAAGALYPVPNADEVTAVNVEGSIEAASINDTLYAYPMTADNGYFLYYNKQYFSESDVETLDQILQIAADNGKKFTMDWTSGWYLYAFFGNTGLEFGINDDNVTNYCAWNATEGDITGVDIAQALLDIQASGGFESRLDSDFLVGVQDGSVIAGVSGVWNSAAMKEAWGDDLGAVKLPTYTVAGQQVQMASFTGYKLMGVNAYSDYPEWAAKLADWFTNEENQTLRFELNGQGPSNTNAAASDAVAEDPSIQAVIAQSAYGKLQRVGNNFWTPTCTFGTIMGNGNPDNVGLQTLLDDMVTGITASVAG